MAFLYYLIIFLHVVACLFLIAVVLLQQGKGQDLASAFGGGGTQTAFGPRGSATVLSRATTILAGALHGDEPGALDLRPRRAASSTRCRAPPRARAPPPSAAPRDAGRAAPAPAEAPAAAPAAAPSPAAK